MKQAEDTGLQRAWMIKELLANAADAELEFNIGHKDMFTYMSALSPPAHFDLQNREMSWMKEAF